MDEICCLILAAGFRLQLCGGCRRKFSLMTLSRRCCRSAPGGWLVQWFSSTQEYSGGADTVRRNGVIPPERRYRQTGEGRAQPLGDNRCIRGTIRFSTGSLLFLRRLSYPAGGAYNSLRFTSGLRAGPHRPLHFRTTDAPVAVARAVRISWIHFFYSFWPRH